MKNNIELQAVIGIFVLLILYIAIRNHFTSVVNTNMQPVASVDQKSYIDTYNNESHSEYNFLAGAIYFQGKEIGNTPCMYYIFKENHCSMKMIFYSKYNFDKARMDTIPSDAVEKIKVILRNNYSQFAGSSNEIHTKFFLLPEKNSSMELATNILGILKRKTNWKITKEFGYREIVTISDGGGCIENLDMTLRESLEFAKKYGYDTIHENGKIIVVLKPGQKFLHTTGTNEWKPIMY
jgi:hypothetical protein